MISNIIYQYCREIHPSVGRCWHCVAVLYLAPFAVVDMSSALIPVANIKYKQQQFVIIQLQTKRLEHSSLRHTFQNRTLCVDECNIMENDKTKLVGECRKQYHKTKVVGGLMSAFMEDAEHPVTPMQLHLAMHGLRRSECL